MTMDAMEVDGPLWVPDWFPTHKAVTKVALQKVSSWPRLKNLHIIYGDKTFWLSFPAIWAIQDFSAELGLQAPIMKLLRGGNHFVRQNLCPLQTTSLIVIDDY